MWCRTFLTIIVISYLICVLLLSGLQKEDLDVNTLRKLQRHNVNIDDMNNEDLRHQCASTSTTDNLDHTNSKNLNVGQSEPIPEVGSEAPKITNSAEPDINTMIKYFIESRKSQDLIIKEDRRSPNSKTALTESILYSSYRNKPVSETNNTKLENNGKTKLDKIKEIINSFTKKSENDENIKPNATPIPSVSKTSTNVNVIKYDNDMQAREMDNISKLIAEYINNHTTSPTSTYPPTTTSINLNVDPISQNIASFIRNNLQQAYINNVLMLNTKPIETEANLKKENDDKTQNKTTIQPINISRNNFFQKQIDKSNYRNNTVSERVRVRNNAIQYISDILQAGQLGIDSPLIMPEKSITENPFIDGTQQEAMHNVRDSNNLYTKLERDNSKKKEEWSTIPADTIRQIAETVKAMVLKELKKDIIITTPFVTTISTTEVTTYQNKQDRGNLEEATHAIEKFMELFQQFKSVKESTITSGDTQFKMTEQKHVKQQYNGPVKIMYPSIITPANPYGIKSKLEPIPPLFINQFNPDLKVNTPIIHHLEIEKQNTVNKLTNKAAPITLQTNSDEIPPLGIPISKPVKLMNQNILVTTDSPLMKPKNDKEYYNYMQRLEPNQNKPSNGMRSDSPKTNAKFTNLAQEPRGVSHHNYRDRGGDKFVNTGRERAKYTDEYSDRKPHKSYYTPHYDRSDYERMRVRNQQVKRFHERLERVDDRTWNSREGKLDDDDGEDSYKYKVASRQQLSINDAKSRSRFDDTHFRNFLKTQQKVNNMLERILATKTKSQGPSVEIP